MTNEVVLNEENEETVNKVSIVKIRPEKTGEGVFDIRLSWRFNSGLPMPPDDAAYKLYVYGDDKCNKLAEFDVTPDEAGSVNGTAQSVTLTLPEQKKANAFSVSLYYVNKKKESAQAELAIFDFDNLSGSYTGDCLNIGWDKVYDGLSMIFCDVYRDNGVSRQYIVPHDKLNLQITIPDGGIDLPLNADIYSAQSNDSNYGIVQKLRFFPRVLKFNEFERSNNSLTANVTVSCSDAERENLKLQPCIVKDGEIVKCFDALDIPQQTSVITVPDFFVSITEGFYLGAVLKYNNASTLSFGGLSCLPLSELVLTTVEYTREKVLLEVGFQGSGLASGFVGSDNKTYNTSRIEIASADGVSFSLRPLYRAGGSECKGISSNAVDTFCERYAVENEFIYYCQKSENPESVTLGFDSELFLRHLTEGISSTNKIISLEPGTEPLYTLTVNTKSALSADNDNSELNSFFEKLFTVTSGEDPNPVNPEGFYSLADAVSRMCRCKLSDVNKISRNFYTEKRHCAVLPNDMLKVETSLYVPQPDPETENISGYMLSCCANYSASLCGSGSDASIVFDPFVRGMCEGMQSALSVSGEIKRKMAGITDLTFLNKGIPYLYLVYPVNYYPTDYVISSQPYDNVFLIGDKSYATLLEKIASIAKNASDTKNMQGIVFFSGRSSISILIGVYFNGELCSVPVGTSVRSLLNMRGYGGNNYRLFRRNAWNEYCPVFIADNASDKAVLLLSGDRIEA